LLARAHQFSRIRDRNSGSPLRFQRVGRDDGRRLVSGQVPQLGIYAYDLSGRPGRGQDLPQEGLGDEAFGVIGKNDGVSPSMRSFESLDYPFLNRGRNRHPVFTVGAPTLLVM